MTGPTRAVPRLLVLTDRRQSAAAGRPLVETVRAAASAGAPAVLLREKDLPAAERRRLASTLAAAIADHGTVLLVASDPDLARAIGAGVHLAAADPPVAAAANLLVGRSCHDAAEVSDAVAEDVDYVTVSPVAPTASKPGHGPALGPDGLAALAAVAGTVPVLALGGVTPAGAGRWLTVGAHGLAVMGAVMGADDPATTTARLLAHVSEEALP